MSTENKDRFDTYFKLFIAMCIAAAGWYLNNMTVQFDEARKDIKRLEIHSGSIQTAIDDIKDDLREIKQRK